VSKTKTLRIVLFVSMAYCALGVAGAVAAENSASDSKQPPNVLFIFADDMTFDGIHALGNGEVQTPNLDRLVARGTTFRYAYNQGAWHGAVCVASRTMINTGRFLWHAKAAEGRLGRELEEGRIWSAIMDRAGYDTYFSGKWHVKLDARKAFDFVGNVRPGMPNQTKAGYNRPLEGQDDPWSPYDTKFGGFWKGGKHWSEVLGDVGSSFLAQAGQCERPFFMYLAFNAPHDPRQSPKRFVDRYPLDKVAVPENFLPQYPHAKAAGCPWGLRDERLAPMPRTPHSVKVHRQEYYAIITHMDEQIGRLLDALDKTGKAENTYVFFTADHGLAVGHHGLMGKQNMYDHSLRVPLVVVGPDVSKNERLDAPVYLQDIMPTSVELAGAEVPDYVQFQSLAPLWRGQRDQSYEAIYGAYKDRQRAVIDDGWKLILYPTVSVARLYHVAEDPLEMKDLADQPEQLERMRRLFGKLQELQKETGDQLDLATAFPKLVTVD